MLFRSRPVITNLTSDIEDYIIDGRNGIIIPNDIALAADKLVQTLSSYIPNSIAYSEEVDCPFDYSLYIEKMKGFLLTL